MLWKICGPEGDGVTVQRLHKEQLTGYYADGQVQKTCGPERDEVTVQRLHKEQLTGYYADGQVQKNVKGGEGEKYTGKQNKWTHKDFGGKAWVKKKGSLGRPGRKWEDNIEKNH